MATKTQKRQRGTLKTSAPKKRSAKEKTIQDFLVDVRKRFDAIPAEAWKNKPHDLSKNIDHYLYGLQKQEE